MNPKAEATRCLIAPDYFINKHCFIYDSKSRAWIKFKLWKAQTDALFLIENNKKTVVLKARQLGLSWLVLCYALWLMLFRPQASILLFSKGDKEAVHLLDFRLKGIYKRLPSFLQAKSVKLDNKHEWLLSNESMAMSFASTGGRSFTGTFALIDEAAFTPDLSVILNAVQPTVDAGGQLVIVSTADKRQPISPFNKLYKSAKENRSWAHIFLPWYVHPYRDQSWYEEMRREILGRTGAEDDLFQEYPGSDVEALAPRTLDKRIPPKWLNECYEETEELELESDAPTIPTLKIYKLPEQNIIYIIGGDPAEGNPNSDDSALSVIIADTGEEVAVVSGKFQPEVLAQYAIKLSKFYNNAKIMIERNNHGHAVILVIKNHKKTLLLKGHDDKYGWNSSALGKTLLYDECTTAVQKKLCIIHSFKTLTQLASIEANTLRAPTGLNEDCADAYALAKAGSNRLPKPKPKPMISPIGLGRTSTWKRN